jgi:AcrR family transcriptional regulator
MPRERTRPYHHGDLRAALVAGAAELLAESGVRRFSLAEVSRRIGVTVGAPYRHFANRDELLAAVALRALRDLSRSLEAEAAAAGSAERRLAAMAAAYVRFAAERPAEFGLLFGFGLDRKGRYPELRQAYEDVESMLEDCVAALCPGKPEAAEQLVDAVEAAAHGYATLLTDGPRPPDPVAVQRAVERAATTTLALIRGRAALGG